jgi:hypothetical protein
MAQRRIHNIRTANELPADRESRPSVRRRAERVSFGLYLPLRSEIELSLGGAVKDATDFMAEQRRGPSAEIHPHDDFGLTFVHRRLVSFSIRDMVGQGFTIAHLVEALQAAPDAVGYEGLEVPISDFSWVGTGRRKLAARIDEGSVAFGALCHQAAAIEETVGKVRGGSNVDVRMPDHVSLATYGRPRDGMSLSRAHRGDVAAIFHDRLLSDQGNDQLTFKLGSLVVGTSYSQPFEGMELESILSAADLVEPVIELDEELAGAGLEYDFGVLAV